jgi:deoxyadenosine/deoxycytidine kinase
MSTIKIVSIEGNIGSGKSTLVKKLKELMPSDKYVFIAEPVDVWSSITDKNGENILEKFYRDQTKYAFPFQMMAYISRLHLIKETMKNNPEKVIIIERSCLTDRNVFAKMLYDDEKIEDVCYQIYNMYFDHFLSALNFSNIIFVNTDPNICHRRVNKRDRSGEDNISLAYLEKCHQYHLDWLSSTDLNILEVNGNSEFETDEEVLMDYVAKVKNFIS